MGSSDEGLGKYYSSLCIIKLFAYSRILENKNHIPGSGKHNDLILSINHNFEDVSCELRDLD